MRPGTLEELAELLVAEADARLINTYKVRPGLIEAFRERLRLNALEDEQNPPGRASNPYELSKEVPDAG